MGVTIHDVAREAGVSLKTVSRVVNNESQVSLETRIKVEQAIAKLGYQPNNIARSLRKSKTNTVGYIIPDISNQFFGLIGRTIERILRRKGYSLIISSTNNDPKNEIESLGLFASQKVDGIILATLGETKEFIKSYLHKFEIPIVAIDNKLSGLDLDLVLHDNHRGSYILARHLIEHGHQYIAFISGPLDQTSGELRFQGYRRALEESGIDYRESLVRIGDWQIKSGYDLVLDLLEDNVYFTSVFAANFYMALGCLRALKKRGLRVPKDVAIVSFDNLDFAEFVDPPLTTLRRVEHKIGVMATKLLLKRIEARDQNREPTEVLIPAKLSVRESCGCPRKTLLISKVYQDAPGHP